MSSVFLFYVFAKILQSSQYLLNDLIPKTFNLHQIWSFPTLATTLSVIFSLAAMSFCFYCISKWMGWRSLVVLVVDPRIWIILFLYTKSKRLFWQEEWEANGLKTKSAKTTKA